jgi:aryl-alcohol dehydrogenase-like predicted oxidoreductase
MRYRTLGPSGLRVSELILGAMTFGEQGGVGAPIEECRRILDAYAEAGGNTIDTAINYRGGASEEILGRLLAGRRESFVLGTKYTVSRDPNDPNAAGNARKNLRASLEVSLRRLGTDYLDVYWVHMWDRATPIEETMHALDDAVRAGKILYAGISDAPSWVVAQANTLAAGRDLSPFVAIQVPYSLLQRDIERELLPMAEAFGLGVAVWSPLAGGVLSGKYTVGNETRGSAVHGGTRLDPSSLDDRAHAAAQAVQAVADARGVSPSQVAIAWTMTRSPNIHPILGARRLEQVQDNLGALDVRLTADECAQLEAAVPFSPGFPTDFIESASGWVFGAANVM